MSYDDWKTRIPDDEDMREDGEDMCDYCEAREHEPHQPHCPLAAPEVFGPCRDCGASEGQPCELTCGCRRCRERDAVGAARVARRDDAA